MPAHWEKISIKFYPGISVKALFLSSLFFILFQSGLSGQEKKQVEVTSDYVEYDSDLGKGAKRLIGDVRFKHEDVYMTCDSAYYYSEENVLDAFSHVHAWQGDTLDLYGDYLQYDGSLKTARIRKNVILIDKESRLTTNYVDHFFNENYSYYLGGGKIVNGDNTLESMIGYYYSKEKVFYFKDSVVVINPDYDIFCDTLRYHTQTEVSYFFGPTEIISDENYIYCENGWYDTRNEIAQFNENAYLQSEGTSIRGDSLYYERETGMGKAFRNIVMVDTTQDIVMKGNRAIYFEDPEYAMVTDSAIFIQLDNTDSLFVHADTLLSIPDTMEERRIIKAYYHVKFFREDFQGKCDSLTYSEVDSIFRFYGDPVLWSDEHQLTSEFIELHTRDRQLDRIEMLNSAFIVSMEDSSKFNQIKGRNMSGYIKNNELQTIHVTGNAETIYYGKDMDVIVGVNKAVSSNLVIYFQENKIQRIVYLTQPSGTYYPIEKFATVQSKLENFRWLDDFRPKTRDDIFIWNRGKSTEINQDIQIPLPSQPDI